MELDKFPQPTSEELTEEAIFWLSFNPYFWKVFQGEVERLNRADRWENLTEEIETALINLMQPHEVSFWVHSFDFMLENGGFTALNGRGTWGVSAGWSSNSNLGKRGIEIEREVSETTITGVILSISNTLTSPVEMGIYAGVDASETMYYEASQANTSRLDLKVENEMEGTTKIRLKILGANTLGGATFRRLTLWGRGVNPFL